MADTDVLSPNFDATQPQPDSSFNAAQPQAGSGFNASQTPGPSQDAPTSSLAPGSDVSQSDLASSGNGSFATNEGAPTPASPLGNKISNLQFAARAFMASAAAGFGQKNAGQAISAGVNAGFGVAQKANDDKDAADTKAEQAPLVKAQMAAAVAQQQANIYKLHQMTPGNPEFVQAQMEKQADQTAEDVKAGAQVLFTGDTLADVQGKIHSESYANGNFEPQVRAIYGPDESVHYAAVIYPATMNSQPITITMPDGTPKTLPANSISMNQLAQLQPTMLANTIKAQQELMMKKSEQDIKDNSPSGQAEIGLKKSQTREADAKAGEANAKGALAKANMNAGKDENGNWNMSSTPVQLVEGNMAPSQLSKRSGDYDAKMQAANQYSMQKYGKPWSPAQAQIDYTYANNPQTQNTMKALNNIVQPNGAIDIAKQAAQGLPALNSATMNKVFNTANAEFGDHRITDFRTAMLGLADNYSKVQGGGVSTDSNRQQSLNLLKESYSKGQLAGALDIMRQDLNSVKSSKIGDNRYMVKQYGAPQQTQPQQGQAQPAQNVNLTPQTHSFSVSAWQKANPGGDVNAMKQKAIAGGFNVVP